MVRVRLRLRVRVRVRVRVRARRRRWRARSSRSCPAARAASPRSPSWRTGTAARSGHLVRARVRVRVRVKVRVRLRVRLRVRVRVRARVTHLGRLDAERREQNEVARSGGAGGVQAVERGLVVDSERVLLRARPARQATDHHVSLALLKWPARRTERLRVAHIGLHERRALELGLAARLGHVARHGGRRVAAPHRLSHDRLADVASGADHGDPLSRARLARNVLRCAWRSGTWQHRRRSQRWCARGAEARGGEREGDEHPAERVGSRMRPGEANPADRSHIAAFAPPCRSASSGRQLARMTGPQHHIHVQPAWSRGLPLGDTLTTHGALGQGRRRQPHSQAEMTSIQQPSGGESKSKGRGRQNDGRGGGRGRGGGEQPAGGGAATGAPAAAVKAAPQPNGSATQGTEGNSVRYRTPEPAAQRGRESPVPLPPPPCTHGPLTRPCTPPELS